MPLPAGARLGTYEILGLLGAGGMGEVYRARDGKLRRDVAIKILPAAFATDPDRLARFEREAQVLASLNHPNIAAIYGFVDAGAAGAFPEPAPAYTSDGGPVPPGGVVHGPGGPALHGLVLELVDGPTLADRIAEGAIPLDEALPIAKQIAEALEAAHEAGVIHRDLKPANIKLRSDGTVKVLDFGLAKLVEVGGPGAPSGVAGLSMSPTITSPAMVTGGGVILGTAAYMSPEQARGRHVDKRTDIWAFGCVLFEMLTGKRPFGGEDVSLVLSEILQRDPDWSALPRATPASILRLLHRSLAKDHRSRLADIADARLDLVDRAGDAASSDPARGALQQAHRAGIRHWATATVALACTTIGAIVWQVWDADAPKEPVRFTMAFPPGVAPLSNGSDYHGAAISPDGRRLVFSGADVSTGRVSLYARRIDDIEALPIPGTEGGTYPFWSWDSRSVAFYAQGKLKRIDVDGGAPQVICDAPTGGWGGTWNRDDVIVAGLLDPGPLYQVSARGGTPALVTQVDSAENDHDWPVFLPDGRHFVFTAWQGFTTGRAALYLASLDSTDRTLLIGGLGEPPVYVDPGYLLFLRSTTLMAQRFDPSGLKVIGEPVVIAANAGGPIAASTTTVAYATMPAGAANRLVWIQPDGTESRPLLAPGYFLDPALSPDGKRLAFARRESIATTFDIWVLDLRTGGVPSRLTFDPADDRAPVWSPDGETIVFSSTRPSGVGLYRKQANGSGEDVLVSPRDNRFDSTPYQWPTLGSLTYYGGVPSWNISLLSLADGKSTPLVASAAVNESRGAVSPDGRWFAYDSRETARFEVYLTTFPPSASKWMVTTDGGAEPKWSRDGRTLFYVNSVTGALMSVDVATAASPSFSGHRQLFAGPLDWGWSSSHSFDLDRSTGRVLAEVIEAQRAVTVVVNWQSLLRE